MKNKILTLGLSAAWEKVVTKFTTCECRRRIETSIKTIITLTLSVGIILIGCGEEELPPPANVMETIPSDDESIDANGMLTIRFDVSPVEGTVQVNGKPAERAGVDYRWQSADTLKEGVQTFEITWENEDGSAGKHTITLHVIPIDLTPPRIVSSNPRNGDEEYSERVNAEGMEIKFSEPVKNVTVDVTVYGEVLKWKTELSDDKMTAKVVKLKGEELSCETEYVLVVNAEDFAGNKLSDAKITFTTVAIVPLRWDKLVGMWWFYDEGKGDVLTDYSGNSNHGKIKGDAKWIERRLAFDGLNTMVEIPNSPTLNITKSITIIAWIKPNQLKGVIVGKEGAYGMALTKEGIKWVIWGDEFVAKVDIKEQEWYKIVLVYDFEAKKRSVYFNGPFPSGAIGAKLIAEKETAVTIPVSNHPLTIGKWATLGEAFNGSIWGVFIWNVALTEDEIKHECMICA